MDSWQSYEFSSIAKLSKDKFDPKKEKNNAVCIELEHISKETGRLIGSTNSDIQLSTKTVFKKGQILFGKLRPNLKKYIYCAFDGVCSSEIWVLVPQQNIYPKFLFYLVQQEKFIASACIVSGSKMPRSDWNYVSTIPFSIPPKNEQKAIANILQACDTTIEKAEALIAAKEKQFNWLVSSCINKSGYEKSQLSNLTSEVSKRNGDRSIERVLSVTNHSGFVLPENQFERRVASANLSNYKIVSKGEYAYNPSRINVGSIARLDNWDIGVLSPMYVVFELDSMKIDSDYFLHWLSSSEARQRIKNSAQGSVRETVGFSDLGAVPIALPNIETQKRIAHTLNTARQEIDTLKTLADRYRTQKRGLMQKLLTGKWRVKV